MYPHHHCPCPKQSYLISSGQSAISGDGHHVNRRCGQRLVRPTADRRTMKDSTLWRLTMKATTAAVLCLITLTGSVHGDKASKAEPVPDKIVVMKLDGEIRETPPAIDLGLPDIKPNLFWDQLRLIRMAERDTSVKGLIVLIDQPEINLAQAQQVLAELKRFRRSGKKVFVHADGLQSASYLLTLPADQIAMTPGAILWLTGVRAHVFYFKELMNKLGIDADVEHVGQYKLAAEPFTDLEPSPEMKKQLNELIDDVYEQITTEISAARKLKPKRVKAIIDEGPFLAEQAAEVKLIDRASHRSEFLSATKKELGGRLIFDYGRRKIPHPKPGLAGIWQMFSLLGAKVRGAGENKIAVVTITGFLIEGESEDYFGDPMTAGTTTLRKAFKQINKDSTIKAVVVRVDSPGGSSSAAEIMWNLIHTAAKRKPVVISMSAEAASGGYYLACAGSYIFAAPATLTGSIGVIAGKPVLGELLTKIGVKGFSVTRGKNADIMNPFARFSQNQRETLKRHIEQVYQTFKQRVTQGRAGKVKNVSSVATGQVFTGRQAQKLGLIDQIGTLADAVEWAAKKSKTKSYQVTFLPRPKTLFEIILEGLGYNVEADGSHTAALMNMMNSVRPASHTWPSNALSEIYHSRFFRQARVLARLLTTGDVLALAPLPRKLR